MGESLSTVIKTKDEVIRLVRDGWKLCKSQHGQSLLRKNGMPARIVDYRAAEAAVMSEELGESFGHESETNDGMLF